MNSPRSFLYLAMLLGIFISPRPARAGAPATTRAPTTQPAKLTEIWIKGESEMYSWGNMQPAVFRIYREPLSDEPLQVYFKLSGTSIAGKIVRGSLRDHTDVRQPPDMDYYLGENVIPVAGDVYKIIIPAGAANITFECRPVYQTKLRSGGVIHVDLLRPQPTTRPSPQTKPTTRPAGGK